MFFPIKPEEWSQALGRIRRLRNSRNWERIGTSDTYWTAPFLAALVETVDSLLLEDPEQALKLSQQGILVAERIRPIDCPGGELGKRSLIAWAHATHGSACRAMNRLPDAGASFQTALGFVAKRVMIWAAAETWRRYAALLLFHQKLEGLAYLDRALEAYSGIPAGQADTLVLRALFHFHLRHDHAAAVSDASAALKLVEAKRSPREARTWKSAIHNLGVVYSRGAGDLATIETTLKRVREAGKKLSRHEPLRRMFCLWIQGLLLAPLGATRKAAKLIAKAGNWMDRNGHPMDGWLCLIDLAILHFNTGEISTAQSIVEGFSPTRLSEDLRDILELRLSEFRSQELNEKSLAELREAVELLTLPGSRRVQPLGMVEGEISSSGSSPVGLAAG